MRLANFLLSLAALALLFLASPPAGAQPILIDSNANAVAEDLALGNFGQDAHAGVVAAWRDSASEDLAIDFYRYEELPSSNWAAERIAQVSDVATSPTDSPAPAVRIVLGDYSRDGKTDLTVMYNSNLTTTSLKHYQRTSPGFAAGDTSMANIASETNGEFQARFWQDIALADIIGDGVPTLISHSIDLYRTATGSANSQRHLGYGAQDIYFHRRDDGSTPFGSGSHSADKEIARTTTEEGPLAVGDVTGDGEPELIWAENIWNRSPGWGHQFTLYVASNNGGAAGGAYDADDRSEYYDEQPTQMYPNGTPTLVLAVNEFLYGASYGQFGVTAMVAGQDITRDGTPDIVVARHDDFYGVDYGAANGMDDTDDLGVLQVLQISSATGALAANTTFAFDTEDFGTYKWTHLASADVNCDGEVDLVAVAENTDTGNWHLFLYEWDQGGFVAGDGPGSNGWPTDDTFVPPDAGSLLNSATRTDLIPASSDAIVALAVGSADGDADDEIVYSLGNGEIYVLDICGDLKEVPVNLSDFLLE
ncbi:MAG TPA: hypothetical protein PK847_05100 [Candidatus Sumerlaeota bacterium]|nr:hypothetical protein [Candidatus Sumerlaeota bacterium]HOR27991.1 hypothetical protein [Candidatus Sumerlaeota bacterium]